MRRRLFGLLQAPAGFDTGPLVDAVLVPHPRRQDSILSFRVLRGTCELSIEAERAGTPRQSRPTAGMYPRGWVGAMGI